MAPDRIVCWHPPVSAPTRPESADRLAQVVPREVGAKLRAEIELAVGYLPQWPVRQSLLAPCADYQIGVG